MASLSGNECELGISHTIDKGDLLLRIDRTDHIRLDRDRSPGVDDMGTPKEKKNKGYHKQRG